MIGPNDHTEIVQYKAAVTREINRVYGQAIFNGNGRIVIPLSAIIMR